MTSLQSSAAADRLTAMQQPFHPDRKTDRHGFVPTAATELQKKAIPEQLIPADGIHTGDGWCWQPLPDGGVKIYIINPANGYPAGQTVLSQDEWVKVKSIVDPPPPLPSVEPDSVAP